MSLPFHRFIAVAAVVALAATTLWAQRPGVNQQQGNQQQGNQQGQGNRQQTKQQGKNAPKEVVLEDPRLIDLHRQFVENVEKLAGEYEKKGDLEKARHCYDQIVRLLPQYAPAKEKLDSVKAKESVAEKKVMDIFANKEWQDTGITVGEGKPVSIKASGNWKIRIDYDVSPDGVEIPQELKDYNIGSLVGMIVNAPGSTDPKDNSVFSVGTSASFTAKQTGRLFLRMYDAEPKDNLGKLSVEITGSFEKKGTGT